LKKTDSNLKKPIGLVRFYKSETEKTEPNRTGKKTRKKLSQNRKNRSKPEKTEPKPVDLNRYQFGLSFFFNKLLV
jgi:hypothetical protein